MVSKQVYPVTSLRAFARASCSARNKDAGFTLAEMLVTLTILAIMAGMTTVFFGQLRKVSEIHRDREIQQELEQTTRYLERSIESALALPIDISQNQDRSFLSGNASQLTFLSASRVGIKEATLRTRQIRIVAAGQSNNIVQTISTRRFQNIGDAASEPISVTVLNNVEGLRFEYFGKSLAWTSAVWSNAWSRDRSLPIAVKFTINTNRNGRSYQSTGLASIQAAQH